MDKAAEHQFGEKTSSIKKVCPKGTFLGLAEDGHIKGIPAGNYTLSVDNKRYGVKALELLKTDSEIAKNKSELWRLASNGHPNHEGQMDVVLALWENHLLI